MKKIRNLILIVGVYLIIFTNKAQAAIVNCDGFGENPCGFDDFIGLLNNLFSFIIFRLPLLLFVFVLAYGGFNLLFKDRSKPDAWKQIKDNLKNLILGYLLVLGAYLIVKTFVVLLTGGDLDFKTFFN